MVTTPFRRRKSGIYSIPWKCGQLYIEQRRRSINNGVEEHDRHMSWTSGQIGRGEAQHQFGTRRPATGHQYPLHQMKVHGLYFQGGDWDWAAPNNMNRKDDIFLSKIWKPLISSLKECSSPLTYISVTWFFRRFGPFTLSLFRAWSRPFQGPTEGPFPLLRLAFPESPYRQW
jgi:hypothetical protein